VEGREGEENGEGRGGEERKWGIASSLFNFWLRACNGSVHNGSPRTQVEFAKWTLIGFSLGLVYVL